MISESSMEPNQYDAWYSTLKGSWISNREVDLMLRLLQPTSSMKLLDVGSGTGHFTRRFANSGLQVVGLEPDRDMLNFSRRKHSDLPFVSGYAQMLPFKEKSFDLVTAVTSLCFVSNPEIVLQEMWRVAKCGVLAGVLNSKSLLHRQKAGRGGYRGARWDSLSTVKRWGAVLDPPASLVRWGTAIFFPGGSFPARKIESCLPTYLPWGGFLAIFWSKK